MLAYLPFPSAWQNLLLLVWAVIFLYSLEQRRRDHAVSVSRTALRTGTISNAFACSCAHALGNRPRSL